MRIISLVYVVLVELWCASASSVATSGVGINRIREDGNNHHIEDDHGDVNKSVISLDRSRASDFYSPCEYEDDIDCVRQFFISSGQCHGVHNYDRQPMYRDRLLATVPSVNLTAVLTKSRIQFSGDKISRFYVNKISGNLVMAIDFKQVTIDHRRGYFYYRRRGEEPIVRSDFVNGIFALTLTAVIPIKDGVLNMKGAKVTPYLDSYAFTLGPKILESTDPLVVQVNTAIYANSQSSILQYYDFEGPSQFLGYLQKYICDFGLPTSNVI